MLKAFAIDPRIFDSWLATQLWAGRFGPSTCRMIAEYPPRWRKLVLKGLPEVSEIDRKRIVRTLEKLSPRLMRSELPYNDKVDWVENAHFCQKTRNAFHAVIASNSGNVPAIVLLADEVEDDSPEFHVPTGVPVARRAEAMADAVQLFLFTARQLKFIDSYLIPDRPKYRRTIKAFLRRVNPKLCTSPIEFHIEEKGDGRSRFEAIAGALHELVPLNLTVHFHAWRKLGREAFHGRYILDQRTGFSFDHGLDEGGESQTTDVNLVSEEIRHKRWADFDTSNPSGEYQRAFSIEVRGQVDSRWTFRSGGDITSCAGDVV